MNQFVDMVYEGDYKIIRPNKANNKFKEIFFISLYMDFLDISAVIT